MITSGTHLVWRSPTREGELVLMPLLDAPHPESWFNGARKLTREP